MVGAISPSHAVDELKMVITKGRTDAQEISVVPFGWMGASGAAPIDIAGIIASDLERSGRFAPTPVADLPGRPVEKEQINFSDWRLLGPLNLVIGQLQPLPGGRYAVRFRLFDVFKGTQVSGFEFEALPAELRRTAHEISDIIYEALTGEPGAFNTRIAYVTEVSLGAGEKRYTLHVADSDGENAHVILESTQPLLSPAWSPDGRRLAYVSFEGRRPRVYVQDLASGQRESVSSYRGLNSAPAWSPDGRRLALTLSKDGNAEIYVLDLSSRRLQRITHNGAIDTEPAWSPDGQSIVFTSDRGGKPQIYQIPAGGGRATRLTFEGSYNARATYAPDGGRLAFVHGREGVYRIALLDLGNGALLTLTDSTLDESPSFAPNGSMLLYATTDTAGAALAAVSVDGEVHQRLAVQKGNVREPAWSPFRKPR